MKTLRHSQTNLPTYPITLAARLGIHTLMTLRNPSFRSLLLAGLMVVAMGFRFPAGAALLIEEVFDYPDGPLAALRGSPWITQGGTAFQLNVTNGQVELYERESEDLAAGLATNPIQSGDLYVSFTLQILELPRGDGNYFLHLKDSGSSQKARVWISTNNAPANSCRIGIANNTGSPQYLSEILGLGETHRVVLHYRVSTPTRSTLWLNPVSLETTSSRVVAEDGNTRLTSIYGISLRQALTSGDGMGRLLMDELRVVTTPEEAMGVGPKPRLEVVKEGETLVLGWNSTDPLVVEATQSLLNPVWEKLRSVPELMGDEKRLRVPMGLGAMFFRLVSP